METMMVNPVKTTAGFSIQYLTQKTFTLGPYVNVYTMSRIKSALQDSH